MNLQELIQKYIKTGYSDGDASAKVCQDLILTAISNSKYAENITIKGGVVMHNLSNDKRRATNEIVPLHHQDYNGKRVFLRIKDGFDNIIDTKLDIGVHKLFELEQEEYMFDFDTINLGANLLINSPEQIFTEKMKSLLKFNIRSTRYKDVFDFYYLIDNNLLNKEKLEKCFKILIYDDELININNIKDLIEQFNRITNSRLYKNNLNNPKYNWLDTNIDTVIDKVQVYLASLETIAV